MYSVKETFLTVQGEGANLGRVAVFLRFTGCNAWSGRTEDRGYGHGACSAWCDTDFVGTDGLGGGRFTSPYDLSDHVAATWNAEAYRAGDRWVVCTGGEPLLQLDDALVRALRLNGFRIAVETNGSQMLPMERVDWVCVSPKAGLPLRIARANEIKVVVPQDLDLEALANYPAPYHWLMPQDGPNLAENIETARRLCLQDPRWRLGIQAHKYLGLR